MAPRTAGHKEDPNTGPQGLRFNFGSRCRGSSHTEHGARYCRDLSGRSTYLVMITLCCSLLAALLSAGSALTLSSATDGEVAVELVQMLAGTQLSDRMSNGNTLPQVKRPWGFNDWAPHTSGRLNDNAWWFHTADRTFFGFKCSCGP